MDFIDYREKLGIGFCDDDKFKFFTSKLFNFLGLIKNSSSHFNMERNEYINFCDLTGTKIDFRILDDYRSDERLQHCISVLENHTSYLTEFLPYIISFINSMKTERNLMWNRPHLVEITTNMMEQSHIPYELIKDDDEYFIFPKGAKELDNALVSAPLAWLSEYPNARTAWIKALKEYADQTDENASDIADKFRKALETSFQEILGVKDRSLEKFVKNRDYEAFLDKHQVPKELRKEFENTVNSYCDFINQNAKHHDKTSRNVLEYIMYQTGNIIRFLITLKQEEQTDAD